VLFIEHKLLYQSPLFNAADDLLQVKHTGVTYPVTLLSFRDVSQADLTLVCYGYMAELAREAMLLLAMEYEIFAEVIVYTQLSPSEATPLVNSVRRTAHLITLEEGGLTAGWGSELVALTLESLGPSALKAVKRVAARDLPIASTRVLEENTLPSVDDIVQTALTLLKR
jgi:pyruvate/2-oxoglutarate/acetoin dehydrogenase E1 component